jgi:hypothetical protein
MRPRMRMRGARELSIATVIITYTSQIVHIYVHVCIHTRTHIYIYKDVER